MFTSIKTLALAIALPFAAALPLSQPADTSFDSSKPFTLQTQVLHGNSSFGGQYLTGFHVGAGQSTIVGTTNSSRAIGWLLNDGILQEPLSLGGNATGPSYNVTLVEQAPFRSNAPPGYDYIDLSLSGKTTSGFYFANHTLTYASSANSTAAPESFDGCFALCHVNGTAPYFTLGSQYQLLWKTNNATTSYATCADVKLVAANVASA